VAGDSNRKEYRRLQITREIVRLRGNKRRNVNHYGAKEIIATEQGYMNSSKSIREWKKIQNSARQMQ